MVETRTSKRKVNPGITTLLCRGDFVPDDNGFICVRCGQIVEHVKIDILVLESSDSAKEEKTMPQSPPYCSNCRDQIPISGTICRDPKTGVFTDLVLEFR